MEWSSFLLGLFVTGGQKIPGNTITSNKAVNARFFMVGAEMNEIYQINAMTMFTHYFLFIKYL